MTQSIGTRILMKRVEPDDSVKRVEPSQEWPPGLFEEIVDLLAEALVLDYQRIRRVTVNSPPRSDRKNP